MLLEQVKHNPNVDLSHLITSDIKKLGKLFSSEGHEIRIVGGAVRDAVLGKDPKDIDLATTATPEEMLEIAKKHDLKYIETGLQHGTITIVLNGEPYEITTLRVDVDTDGRHADVEWTKSFKEDAARRDLTFNAMSVDMRGRLYDYFDGVDDLKKGKASFVGDTEQRVQEDYLRILRYFRFLGRQPSPSKDEQALQKIKKLASGLKQISGERIWSELGKVLTGKNVSAILSQMDEAGVLDVIGLDNKRFKDAEKTSQLDAEPTTVLCHLIRSGSSFLAISKSFKLSNHEKKLGIFVKSTAGLSDFSIDNENDWKKALVIDGTDRNHLIQLALYEHKPNIAQAIKNYTIPEFSLTGNDLIKQGYKPGPELGKELQRKKIEWFNNEVINNNQ